MKKLIVVADDAGFASTDRGIAHLAAATGLPLSAEYMIEEHGAIARAREMQRNNLVSIGLHFTLGAMSDAERYHYGNQLHGRGLFLGEMPEIRAAAEGDARRQMQVFAQELGRPAHISTHGNFNLDYGQCVMPWWNDLMDELFDGNVPPMQLGIPHVRHNLYKWTTEKHRRAPMNPEEFGRLLSAKRDEALEFVVHPALPMHGDPSINMLFDADSRIDDLASAIAILQSGVIEESGYEVVPVSALGKDAASTTSGPPLQAKGVR